MSQTRARRLISKPACYHPSRFAEPQMRVARHFLVSGRVQGVGFRYFAQDAAAREGLHGWVRNLPSGDVEAVAEGDLEAVERFERALRQGPRGSRVDRVDASDEVPNGRETGFSVR